VGLFPSFSSTPFPPHLIELISPMGRFKAAPGLVAAFEARRLPRSFLVLLESLLNKTPAARPSCERVAGAIREGKVGSSFSRRLILINVNAA
jgi:hypothetical protein